MLKDSSNQMRTGPWLDRLFPIHLPSGRMVSVRQFSVLPSNFGILEGGLFPEANAIQRDKVVALAQRRHGEPVVVCEPTVVPLSEGSRPGLRRERLPWMVCIARLTSAPLDNDMVASELTLLWWQDAFNESLPSEIQRVAASVDWDALARDVDLP